VSPRARQPQLKMPLIPPVWLVLAPCCKLQQELGLFTATKAPRQHLLCYYTALVISDMRGFHSTTHQTLCSLAARVIGHFAEPLALQFSTRRRKTQVVLMLRSHCEKTGLNGVH
jgi:hypothetical protein